MKEKNLMQSPTQFFGLFLLLAFQQNVYSSYPGELDPSFNGNGIVMSTVGEDNAQIQGVAIQADGKIVVSGGVYANSDDAFGLARYNANGSPDTSFGILADGTVITLIGDFSSESFGLTLQTVSGVQKIIAIGRAKIDDLESIDGFALARYNPNGTLDTSFGPLTTGTFITPFDDSAIAYGVAIQDDGKIVVSGGIYGASRRFALARYNANGALDTGFGPLLTGTLTTFIGDDLDAQSYAVVLQNDNKIIAAGYAEDGGQDKFALARYNADGTLDTSFGTLMTGTVITVIGDGGEAQAHAVVIQIVDNIQKIIAVGHALDAGQNKFALARYNADGTLDNSFGTLGTGTFTTIFDDSSLAYGVAIQDDGKIVVSGGIYGDSTRFALARYNEDGTLDTSFGTLMTGTLTTVVGDDSDAQSFAVVLENNAGNQKILAVGYANNDGDDRFTLVRYFGGELSSSSVDPLTLAIQQKYF